MSDTSKRIASIAIVVAVISLGFAIYLHILTKQHEQQNQRTSALLRLSVTESIDGKCYWRSDGTDATCNTRDAKLAGDGKYYCVYPYEPAPPCPSPTVK